MSGGPALANIPKYYLYVVLWRTGFWAGVWIKYLTVSRGFELRWIFLMDLPYWLLSAALETPLGVLGDRIGRRRIMVTGQLLYALTILGFGLVDSYPMLLADYLLWAVSTAMLSGVDQALIYDSMKEAGKEAGFSRVAGRSFAVSVASSFLSLLAAGFIAEVVGLASIVRLSALFPAAAAAVAFTMYEPSVVATGVGYVRDLKDGFVFAWRMPQVRWSIAVGSAVSAAVFAPFILTQPFLIHHEVATRYFGVFQAPLRVGAVAAALLAHRVVTARGTLAPVAAGALAAIVSFALIGTIDRTAAFAFFAVPAVVQGLVRPALDTYINDRVPSERRATILSVWSLALSLQLAFFEPAIGFVADWTSPAGAAMFSAAWFGLLLPPLFWAWRRADRAGSLALAAAAG